MLMVGGGLGCSWGGIERLSGPAAIRTVRTWQAERALIANLGQGIRGIGFKVKARRRRCLTYWLRRLAWSDDALCEAPLALVARMPASSSFWAIYPKGRH